jgi:hypothetical protein
MEDISNEIAEVEKNINLVQKKIDKLGNSHVITSVQFESISKKLVSLLFKFFKFFGLC